MSETKPVEPTCSDLIRLINREAYPEQWIWRGPDGEWFCTSEWLVGTFGGRAFVDSSREGAVNQLIQYFTRHMEHDSMVGMVVRESGWPDLKKVESYVKSAWNAELSMDENGKDHGHE